MVKKGKKTSYRVAPVAPKKDDHVGENEWLAIYGDMMSLLLVFFVLMLAISDIDKEKFQAVINSISQSMGGKPIVVYIEADPKDVIMEKITAEQEKVVQLKNELTEFVKANNLENEFAVEEEDGGLRIRVEGGSVFDSGSAMIRPEMRQKLMDVGDIVFPLSNEIVIEGHTDNVPIKTPKFASNWELSTARATNIVHFFSERLPIDPARLSAAGYAYYRPLYPFDSADNGKNRRIEVFIRKEFSTELAKQISEL